MLGVEKLQRVAASEIESGGVPRQVARSSGFARRNHRPDKLIGASCTLVISHQQNMVGKTYAAIDAVSKPTKKVTPSGTYDPAAAAQRYADWKAKQGQSGNRESAKAETSAPTAPAAPVKNNAAPAAAPFDNSDDVPF